jgi:hypothetical protein
MVAPSNKRFLLESDKAAANGLATLGADSKVPDAQLPTRLGDTALNATYAPDAGGKPVGKGELLIRAEDYPSFQAALDAGASAKKDVIFSSTFVLNSGITWDSAAHSIRGFGDARLDFRGMTSGTALTVVGLGTRNYLDWEFLSEIHVASGFQMRGPEADTTTVDGILITTDTSKASHINFEGLYVKGFRDGVVLGNNTWCVNFHRCMINGARRRGISAIGTTNTGENFNFHGCTIANVKNGSGTGVGVYTSVDCQFLGINMFGTSLDYCDYLADVNAGTLSLQGCHLEDNTSTAMITLSYTAGKARTALALNGCVIDPSETRPGRSHLIEVKSGSGSLVHVTGTGNTFRLFNRPVHVFKNLSTAAPLVHFRGGALDNNPGTDVASYGHYTNQIINGDMEGALAFIPTFDDEGGWYRQGTVVYSFDNTTAKTGTQSLKMLGDGTIAGTGAGQTFRVRPRESLLLSFYIKANIVAGSTAVRVTWKKADKTTLGSTIILATVSATQDWTAYQAQYMVPIGATFVGITFVNTNLNGTTWVDEVVATVV